MKQVVGKFDNLDRNRVIGAVQDHFSVKLEEVGRRSKWLQDESGRRWLVLGGIADWHGVPEEMMEYEIQARSEGMLVVAQKKRTYIEAFSGPLRPLFSARDKLYRAAQPNGGYQYQFTVQVSRDRLLCVQAQNVVLERFTAIPWSAEDKEQARAMNELEKIVKTMSREELATLADKIQREMPS